jgi:hypothetical protein
VIEDRANEYAREKTPREHDQGKCGVAADLFQLVGQHRPPSSSENRGFHSRSRWGVVE